MRKAFLCLGLLAMTQTLSPFLGVMSLTRADIHKGALGLEQIAACFHELAGVADTVVTAQRKLSRALKEGASSKGCPEFASQLYTRACTRVRVLMMRRKSLQCQRMHS